MIVKTGIDMGQAIQITTITRFREFINQAKPLLRTEENRMRPHINNFTSFLVDAKPIVIHQIRDVLKAHRGRLKNLNGVLLENTCDILAAAGLSGDEDRYTKLMAWMLWPEGKSELALRFQKAWLQALGLHKKAGLLKKAVKPETQRLTKNGRLDMVMDFRQPNFVLIVEAKTGTEEHEAPSGEMQTIAYPAALRRSLNLRYNHPMEVVFLTSDGRNAANLKAICTTYETFVMAIADSIEKMSLGLRWAYSFVITHLLEYTASEGTGSLSIIRRIAKRGSSTSGGLSDKELLENVGTLGRLCRSLKAGDGK